MTTSVSGADVARLRECPNPWCKYPPPEFAVATKRDGWRVVCGCGVSTPRFPDEADAIAPACDFLCHIAEQDLAV